MPKPKNSRPIDKWKSNQKPVHETELRIIGGDLGGRKIQYSGDPRTRPMKEVTREAIFNLVGGWVPGKIVIDLFGGSGAVGIEALSRGAACAYFVERHFPTARLIRSNLASLELSDFAEVDSADAFFWLRKFLKTPDLDAPWMVFFCPPYSFFDQKTEAVLKAITSVMEEAPADSVVVIEAPDRFDANQVHRAAEWRFRHYAPAMIGVWRPSDRATPIEEMGDE